MKTKEQIKQGCNKRFNQGLQRYNCNKNKLCPTCQALLEQVEGFRELINNWKDECDTYYDEGYGDYSFNEISFEELMSNITGKEEQEEVEGNEQ